MIFLIGLPGNNQNEVGQKLSEEIGYEFIDLEEIFKKIYKQSILETYNKIGLKRLYPMIRLCLSTYKKLNNDIELVVSTVQGIPITDDFIEYMKSDGILFYVKDCNWYNNIKDYYKEYVFFKDINEDEYLEACKYIENLIDKKFNEIKDIGIFI